MLYGVCMYQTIVVFASRIIINQFSLHPLVYYSYRIFSGQMSNFINGSIQTDSHFSLYCFIHLPTIFTIHNFHLPGFSISPFPFTPPNLPCLHNSICFVRFWDPVLPDSKVVSLIPTSQQSVSSPSVSLCQLLLRHQFLLYPISTRFTLPSETIPPPLLFILHPLSPPPPDEDS